VVGAVLLLLAGTWALIRGIRIRDRRRASHRYPHPGLEGPWPPREPLRTQARPFVSQGVERGRVQWNAAKPRLARASKSGAQHLSGWGATARKRVAQRAATNVAEPPPPPTGQPSLTESAKENQHADRSS
jgi:hypothetical protein